MPEFIPATSHAPDRHLRHPDEAGSLSDFRAQQLAPTDTHFRPLNENEAATLKAHGCSAEDWTRIHVCDPFHPDLFHNVRFEGTVRIGRTEPGVLAHKHTSRPTGITASRLVHCDIGRNCAIHNVHTLEATLIGDQCLLLDLDELTAGAAPRFGTGLPLPKGEPEDRHWIDIGQERGRRAILAHGNLLPADAALWSRHRDSPELLTRLTELTDQSEGDPTGRYNLIGAHSILKSCRTIYDVRIGEAAYIKGANKLKNLTIHSRQDAPTQIGEGVELVNGIMGNGSRAFYGAKAVRFVLGDNAQLKYGARLIHSVLGDNSTVSCCELLNTLVHPAHEQHHNDSFLIAATVRGQSNIAAGATLGSNHNGRLNDGELVAGRGFWAGLCTSVKHPSRFASYTLLAQGEYPFEINQPLPFTLVSRTQDTLNLTPAWWWRHNAWALLRNQSKYTARDQRKAPRQHIVTDPLAPDTAEEIARAIHLLASWTDSLNTQPAAQTLSPIDSGIARTSLNLQILKPAQGHAAYKQMLALHAGNALRQWLNSQDNLQAALNDLPEAEHTWHDLGGQLIPQSAWQHLRADILSGALENWSAIHGRYNQIQQHYPAARAAHALALAGSMLNLTAPQDILQAGLAAHQELLNLAIDNRQRDLSCPFRDMMYEGNEHAPSAANDATLKQAQQDLDNAKQLTDRLIEHFLS